MKKPENVIMHFENNNTAENHQLCAKCNGGCCRHYSGAYGPWQLFDNPEDITPEAIANLLKKTEEYVLDCFEGYSEEHDDGWFIRPPHKPNVPWAGSPFDMDMFGLEELMLFRDIFLNANHMSTIHSAVNAFTSLIRLAVNCHMMNVPSCAKHWLLKRTNNAQMASVKRSQLIGGLSIIIS